jgi:16S rRNA (cytidine1402-2'-O)-methyltransferase
LLVVGTPIGNLDDLSPRAAEALRSASLVLCEDTRRTGPLMRHIGASATLRSAHAHNEAARAGDVVDRIRAGEIVALVTDAGMPGVSDPGAAIVRAALEAGVGVEVVPGPSAPAAALAVAGEEGRGAVFLGFLPRKSSELVDALARADALGLAVVAFESPRRLPDTLAELAARWPERVAVVCRELTKLHEEVVRAPLGELAERFSDPPRGEITIVMSPAPPAPAGGADLDDQVDALLRAGLGPRQVADALASLGLARRNAAYRAATARAERAST